MQKYDVSDGSYEYFYTILVRMEVSINVTNYKGK